MVLLLIIDFRRSTQALQESLRRQQQALDENAVLQAEIRERRRAEHALRESEAKFAAAFRSTPCGVAISTLDEGLVLEINDACQSQIGYQRSEIIGRTTAELGLWIDPGERVAIVSVLRERGKVLNREVRWRAKTGEELTILFSADTVDMHGRSHMLSVALDITAHKQVETRHRAILRAMPDWMFLVSNDGVFLDCHVKDRTHLLAQPGDFIGRRITDVLPPGLAGDLTQLFRRAASTDEPATIEYVVPIDGEDRHYEARAVRCDHDKVLAIVRDVTEGKSAEHEARRLRQELAHIGRVTTLAALTGSLAHEIRQPLAAIRTNAQAAARIIAHAPALAELRNALADIVGDSQRAADVIQRVSALLKRDAPQHAPLDLNASIEDVVKVLRADVLARRISLHLELQPGLPLVNGDRVQLQQVALNFLMNAFEAVEHQPEGRRRVVLRTASDAALVSVTVADTGAGLVDDQMARVFEPFYTTKVDGMGLGLPICEMILDFHEGSLGVDRNAGGGSTFWFRLPACSDVAAVGGVTAHVAAPVGYPQA
jgi:PAS domain S-box-containing protein